MKLNQLLSQLNQVEKTKFINCIDSIRADVVTKNSKVAKTLANIDGQLKSASGSEITLLFNAVKVEFRDFLREKLALSGGAGLTFSQYLNSRWKWHCEAFLG